MKDRFTIGDTLDFVDTVGTYPASDGWTLRYRLTPQFTAPTQAAIDITAATYQTTDYRVLIAPATTAVWLAGVYTWERWVEKVGARHSLGEGEIELRGDPSTATQGYDPRTQAQKALADSLTALANFQATGGRIKRYVIAGREMEFATSGDILSLVTFWKIEVKRENAAKAVADGYPDPRRVYIRAGSAR